MKNFEQRLKEVQQRIKDAWRLMHHNASVLRSMPKIDSEYEMHRFDDWLATQGQLLAIHCQDVLLKRFQIASMVCSAGRGGATFYPVELERGNNGSSFGSFKWDVFHKSYATEREKLSDHLRVAKALEWMNSHVRKEVAKAGTRWEAHKRGNARLRRAIKAHHGKTLKTVQVWA